MLFQLHLFLSCTLLKNKFLSYQIHITIRFNKMFIINVNHTMNCFFHKREVQNYNTSNLKLEFCPKTGCQKGVDIVYRISLKYTNCRLLYITISHFKTLYNVNIIINNLFLFCCYILCKLLYDFLILNTYQGDL